MKKNRYLLCLLLCGVLLYYGVPRLASYQDGMAGIFSITWLAFALMVIAGNLTAILYAPKNKKYLSKKMALAPKNKKIRYFQ
ncbi:hypothetical protein [Niallia sp. NCCP-28]|uniref:hypothetical protein n=1 Tax=Niallia sp. NCCP-28 TaxID=2934712 RepID=UPI002084B270|nr:hypothetical protein [Niallia sp. NCCP-28]GKU81559.1 hypothetical protein NCCP28_09550 [Niallia sp. NCCP-28]